jgi:hypothetical protein
MNRRKHIFAIGITVLMLGFIGIAPTHAAERKSTQTNWESLKKLVTDQQIRVVLNDAKAYAGQLNSVSDEGLVIRTGGGNQTFERQKILRVSTQGKSHRGRNALIGLAVGAGAGIVVGVASPELGQGKCAQGSCVNAESAALAGVAGAAIGTGLGAVLPTGGWHDVYRAR